MKNFIIENKFEVKDSVVKFYGISKTTIEGKHEQETSEFVDVRK